MKLLRFVPIKLTLFLVLGILLGSFLELPILPPLVLVLIFSIALTTVFIKDKNRKSIAFGIVAIFLTLSIGMLSMALSNPVNFSTHYSKLRTQGAGNWNLKIDQVLRPTPFSNRYLAQVLSLNGKKVSGKILLNQPSDSVNAPLNVDDELMVFADTEAINSPLNPHQFDYKKYMQGHGVVDQLLLTHKNHVFLHNSTTTVFGAAAAARLTIISQLEKADFGEEELSIIQALLLGERNDISDETYNDYKNAGAIHILAVSGLHIGILLLLLQSILRPLELLPYGKKLKLALIVLLLWGFAFLAGLSASVVRAVTMFSFVAYALYLNRPSNTFNILALSIFFILLVFDANFLFQVGFQMSYAAVFAIVWIYPLLQKLWSPKNVMPKKIWQLLSVSVAAQLGVLPIGLFYFHQFPGLFFISNLLVVPALGLILGIGILVIVLALMNMLPEFLVLFYNSLIGWMNSVIRWVADQEVFIFRDISFDGVQMVLAYALLICSVLFLGKSSFKRALLIGFCIIGFQLYLFKIEYVSSHQQDLFLAHQSKNTVLIQRLGHNLRIMANDTARAQRLVRDYAVAERIVGIEYRPLENAYSLGGESIFIVDSIEIYPPDERYVKFLILTRSPKVNLARIIDSIRPGRIIADGSNYRSYIDRWQNTCSQRKLPFHYTGEKGAFYFRIY